VLAIRAATGAQNPTDIIGTTIIATLCSTTVAVLSDRVFRFYNKLKNRKNFTRNEIDNRN